MKARWEFRFECKGFRFGKALKYQGTITREHAKEFGLPAQEFEFPIDIEPDEEPKYPGADQTGKLKIILPGNRDQTNDLAHSLAWDIAQQISFSHGEMKLLGGLIGGEHLPETIEEAEQVGDRPFFCEVRLIKYPDPPVFDAESLQVVGGGVVGPLIQQFNAANSASNPIDQFLGLFKILEEIYCSNTGWRPVARVLKGSTELLNLACNRLVKKTDKTTHRKITRADYYSLIGDLVRARNNCAHLRSAEGLGITHGDPKVEDEIEPLLEALQVLTREAIQAKIK